MIIAFEGIDGAGKTTTAELVFRLLESQVPNLRYYMRKSVDFRAPYVQRQMKKLAEVLWPKDIDQQDRDPLGSEFWALLTASWFAATNHTFLTAAAKEGVHLITDSWYFRMIAKMTAEGLDRAWLHSLFQGVQTPDLVVLLDIEPEVAWRRREHFAVFETGGWQLAEGDEYTRFCQWQGRVRSELLSMAKALNWFVVQQREGLSARCLADYIADRVLSILDTKRGGEFLQGGPTAQGFDEAVQLSRGTLEHPALAYALLGQGSPTKPQADGAEVNLGHVLVGRNGHSTNPRSSAGR